MICVLRVIDGPKAGAKCWLKKDQRITIGRLSTSDFCVAEDHHMSRNHLVVEGVGDGFRVRDVGSSNGTFLNDSPVSLVEICNGDQVRAGMTVFQVEVTASDQLREGTLSSASTSGSEVDIPERTLNPEELSFDDEITHRFFKAGAAKGKSDQSADLQTEIVPEMDSADPDAGSLEGSAGAEGSVDAMPDSQVPEVRRVLADTFLMHFRKTKEVATLWKQVRGRQSVPSRILDALLRSDYGGNLSLIVNRYQLGPSEQATLDFTVSTAESRPITNTLYLLQSDRQQIPIEFYKRCLGKDAVVCLGSKTPLRNAYLDNVIDTLSYPSMLYDLVCNSNQRTEEILKPVDFLLFEAPADGGLCLLLDAAD